jgi:hypothetical protein
VKVKGWLRSSVPLPLAKTTVSSEGPLKSMLPPSEIESAEQRIGRRRARFRG